ncbi:c-type cytochrome [Roseibacillus persicicus]|uniref:c-type cytochrome n=1 Tax=Roseibacillus persicicus TaxID=454148 RepID=UPI00280E5A22|nr:c-type cytochrome [Roseibacillus persicicus]MDQ8189198.1 c-type cytochrome [Roseibacillus persicicus]
MLRTIISLILGLWAGLGTGLFAEEQPIGEQLYGLYCAACHGPDGKGAAGAPFPPLAGSEWVRGDARRMVSVILHGLEEPIVVRSKTYDLQMPPQGSVLSDEQVASIVSFVRGSWGNREKPVSPELVAGVREATKEREGLWTAPELLMEYPLPPLPLHRWGVHDLTATVYEGEWEEMPDFSKLSPISEEKEKGPISLSHAGGRRENFAIVWEGTMDSPGDHDSNFFASSVGGLRFYYNGQEVFDLVGQGQHYRHTSARAKASRGKNTFRLEYFQKGSLGGLAMQRSGGSMGMHPLTDTDRDPDSDSFPDILLKPEDGKSALYRNTIEGMSPRAITVGLEGGVNYGFSASTLAMELVWTGDFINAGQHWTVRGTGATAPAGEQVVSLGRGPGLAKLASPGDNWPGGFHDDWEARFEGYDLDAQNRPTFHYAIGKISISDSPRQQTSEGLKSLERTFVVTVPEGASSEGLYLRLASGEEIAKSENGFLVNGSIEIKGEQSARLLLENKSLLLNLSDLAEGQHTLSTTYTWTAP